MLLDVDVIEEPKRARVLLQRDRAEEAVALLEPQSKRDPSDGAVAALLQSAYHQAGMGIEMPPTPARGDYDDGLWNYPWQAELDRHRDAPEIHQVFNIT